MYRYIVDEAITYTPDDLVLFRESPFAVWMERLTLENPDHGIPPDLDSIASYNQSLRKDDTIVATLRAEGRNVVLIDPVQDEPGRRTATLEAMRAGADFIVSGQLSVATLSGAVDLLMRTSGFSDLGDFLYIPCATRADNSLQSSFCLCFFADLLAGLQGQLPPQMLIIRDGAEVVPLQTEDHIYYYRAVQKRFLNAMNEFRKHRMPDPAESAHFGRWAECASEVLKQRACSEHQDEEQAREELHEQQTSAAVVEALPQLRVASGAGARAHYEMDLASRPEFTAANHVLRANLLETTVSDRRDPVPTLAEQARLLKPGSYRNGTPPGHTPSLARIGKPRIVAAVPQGNPHNPPAPMLSFDALEKPDVIESSPTTNLDRILPEIGLGDAMRPAPAPNLRDTSPRDRQFTSAKLTADVVRLPELEPKPPVFLPPDPDVVVSAPGERLNTYELENEGFERGTSSVVDLDSAPVSTLAPVVQRAEAVFERLLRDDPMFRKAEAAASKPVRQSNDPPSRPFSNSLKTSDDFSDS